MEVSNLIKKLRSKEYYNKLLDILVLNGLLDIIELEVSDGKIDYIPLIINLLKFLKANKQHYSNFSSDTFEKILILSADEILTKKFKLELSDKEISDVLELIRDSYLIRTSFDAVKDIIIKMYYKIKCKCENCTNSDPDIIITKSSELDSI
tara:strand:+ start:1923 stop:2375 length:453 start_codon:yes stop_codon:yes gene_type:complete